MKRIVFVLVSAIALGVCAEDMPFWYGGDSSVTNRTAASSVQVSTTWTFDLRLFAWSSMCLQQFNSNPVTGLLLIFR